jgi:predicted GIY-YIG superfamily endonuclease
VPLVGDRGSQSCDGEAMTKRFVYVLCNTEPRPRYYVGITADVAARLTDHNEGRCPHTAKHRP